LFAAGFLYALARDLPHAACAAFGHLAAAEVIGHVGPRPAVSLRELADQSGLMGVRLSGVRVTDSVTPSITRSLSSSP